jgi:hypothetical protein
VKRDVCPKDIPARPDARRAALPKGGQAEGFSQRSVLSPGDFLEASLERAGLDALKT